MILVIWYWQCLRILRGYPTLYPKEMYSRKWKWYLNRHGAAAGTHHQPILIFSIFVFITILSQSVCMIMISSTLRGSCKDSYRSRVKSNRAAFDDQSGLEFCLLNEAMFKIKHSLCPNMTCSQFWYKNASLFNLNCLFVFFILLRVKWAELSIFSVRQCKKCRFCMSNLCFVCKLTYAANAYQCYKML